LVSEVCELLVIGAGPTGLAATATAAALGVEATLLDEQPNPGGQIYRAVEAAPESRGQVLGPSYREGMELVRAFRDSGTRYLPDTQVWSLSREADTGFQIGTLHQGNARLIRARRVILAGGAMERPVPFPGWTLPGVMNAGAAQILFKASGLVPDRAPVIAGTGPLLLLLAWQYLRAGVEVEAVLELAPRSNLWWAALRLPEALRAGHYITRGLKYLTALRRGGVPVRYGVSGIRALGRRRLEALEYRRGGRWHRIGLDTLLVHFGLVPNTHITEAAGCRHFWDDAQQCWRPAVDAWGNSSVPGIAVAGDNATIGGARSAVHSGRLAALEAAHALGLIDRWERERRARADRAWMSADLRIRPFLEALHRLPDSLLATPDDATLVCRCEEVTAGEIRAAVRAGHRDPNQVKFFTRCGMGPCQGRQCGAAAAQIIAAETGRPVGEQPPFRVRPPIRPLSLGELANLQEAE
jgi:NADPH-dependent 2,4-dienoyl-CoA reductase/sulfur reductase-like enzyme